VQPLTWLSPKTEKRTSPVHGRGLFAREPIAEGEAVAVKGGAVMSVAEWSALEAEVGLAGEVHVSTDLVIAPRTPAEYEGAMMHLNHACEPNVGVEGQIVFVALRDVEAGEELVLDYAMFDDHDESMACRCGAAACRGVVTGRDWQRADLQERYRGWFSAYLARRIARGEGATRAVDGSRPALVPELYVSDLGESLGFYVDLLGFEITYDRPEDRFAALRLGGAHLMLEEAPSLAAATPDAWQRGEWRSAPLERPFGRGINLEIRVGALGPIEARLAASVRAPLVGPQERTYRMGSVDRRVRQLLVADPDGYLVRLSQTLSDVRAPASET
jgi:hypothetical protein